MTLRAWLEQAATLLISVAQQPEAEARWLAEHVCVRSSAQLLLLLDQPLNEKDKEVLDLLLARRCAGEPLAYVIGSITFAGLTLKITPPTLIPRPETEEWVTWVTEKLPTKTSQNFSILDLCTGSGCVGLALASRVPKAKIIAVDISEAAVQLAQENCRALGLSNIEVRQGDFFEPVAGEQFDLIVSNPPYLSESEWEHLDPAVATWEDQRALTDHHDGLSFYRQLAQQAPQFLLKKHPGLPQLVCEIGYAQGASVQKIFQDAGWTEVEVYQDLSGKDRWVTAYVMKLS